MVPRIRRTAFPEDLLQNQTRGTWTTTDASRRHGTHAQTPPSNLLRLRHRYEGRERGISIFLGISRKMKIPPTSSAAALGRVQANRLGVAPSCISRTPWRMLCKKYLPRNCQLGRLLRHQRRPPRRSHGRANSATADDVPHPRIVARSEARSHDDRPRMPPGSSTKVQVPPQLRC